MDFRFSNIYRPDRILFYIEPTAAQKEDFYKGILPEVLMKYNGAFGTYDCPGLNQIIEGSKITEVLGIEYRPDDSRIDYPKGLKSIRMKPQFMICSMDTEDNLLDDVQLEKSIQYIKEKRKNFVSRRGVKIKKEIDFIQVFTLNKQNRIFISAEYNSKEDFFDEIVPATKNEKKLSEIAYKDAITGNVNWNYIWPIIAGFGLKGIQDYAFVHFDVKDFNSINVVYGHNVANEILTRIVEHMNHMDWIYYSGRCDNDNFVMMIKDMPEAEMKEKLLGFFNELSVLDVDEHYHIYFRCGVVPMRNTLLLSDMVADAGKRVQRMGNKSYETEVVFYTDEMHEDLDWASKIKVYLDKAIENNEFQVYFQPKIDIKTNKVHGAEALIRWFYHGTEMLSPARFIPVFEQGGLISKLDDIVLHKVCQSIANWQKKGLPLYPVSVNLSRKRMGNPNLVEQLTAIVDLYCIDHSLIDFELTESAAYDNQTIMINVIMGLKNRGFKISMDDFGTGYSTLYLITELPMDTIKIDKSLVDGIDTLDENDKKCVLLKNIIRMTKELKYVCLAEGAETKTQVEKLKDSGCDLVQGFYYSKPLPVTEYEKFIVDGSGYKHD